MSKWVSWKARKNFGPWHRVQGSRYSCACGARVPQIPGVLVNWRDKTPRLEDCCLVCSELGAEKPTLELVA